jgi:hypothetical protein
MADSERDASHAFENRGSRRSRARPGPSIAQSGGHDKHAPLTYAHDIDLPALAASHLVIRQITRIHCGRDQVIASPAEEPHQSAANEGRKWFGDIESVAKRHNGRAVRE